MPDKRSRAVIVHAGFGRVALLIEGSAREVRRESLHLDEATITNESKLYEYTFEEQCRGVHFVETPDQERTALWLTAMTCVLAARVWYDIRESVGGELRKKNEATTVKAEGSTNNSKGCDCNHAALNACHITDKDSFCARYCRELVEHDVEITRNSGISSYARCPQPELVP